MKTNLRWILAMVLALTTACGDGGVTAPDDRVVAGVDLDVLFADPTASELAAVESDWVARSTDAVELAVVLDSTLTVDSVPYRIRVVSHQVGSVLHYGAVLAADTLTAPAPVLVYAHPGDQGADVDDVVALLPFLGDAPKGFVWVIPSFRSETLGFGSQSWTSEGPPSPWDRDVDDALALLDVALEVEAQADSTRVGVLGFSRGAGVGLLMSIRDPRVDGVVAFSGPTDFFGPWVQDVVEDALRSTPTDLPGLDVLDESWLQPLARGEASVAEVRSQLIRRSSVLFAGRLSRVQLHHGTADEVVAVSQARALVDAMDALGRGDPDFQAFLYQGGTHNPLSLANSIPRAVEFLESLR